MPRTTVWGYPVYLDERDGPAVTGLIRPKLILRQEVLELDREKRRTLLTHELEHLRAGDLRLLAFAFVSVALAPWMPWTWILARRVAVAVEADCDRRTLLRRRTLPREYADLLIEVTRWQMRRASPAIRLAIGRDARRLLSRLDRVLPTAGTRRVTPALGVMAAICVVSPVLSAPPRVEARPSGEVTDSAVVVRLRTPQDRSDIDGTGAFFVRLDADGDPAEIETETASGSTFEDRAVAWLKKGEYASPDDALHLWVAARAGSWSVTPVSAELYARHSLQSDPTLLRSFLRTWARLRSETSTDLSTATATFVSDSSTEP